MKFFITVAISLLSVGAFAQGELEQKKQETSSHIDNKISILQEAKNCINNADSMDRYKACKYDMKKQKMEAKIEKKQKMEEKEK